MIEELDQNALLRARVLTLAQDWIDTPYQHQASVKHYGCDCLGFIRGLWRELYGAHSCLLGAGCGGEFYRALLAKTPCL